MLQTKYCIASRKASGLGGLTMNIRSCVLASSGLLCSAFEDQATSQETIKIGANMPIRGPIAASGNYIANGARIADDRINAAGAIVGKKLELLIDDNKGS